MVITRFAFALTGTFLLAWGTSADAQALVIPTPEEAKGAVVRMFGDPQLTKSMATGHVKIGTCKKTTKATHPGQVSCTIAVVMGAGSSETQADFFREGGRWTATPSEETLPFPDPTLQ